MNDMASALIKKHAIHDPHAVHFDMVFSRNFMFAMSFFAYTKGTSLKFSILGGRCHFHTLSCCR